MYDAKLSSRSRPRRTARRAAGLVRRQRDYAAALHLIFLIHTFSFLDAVHTQTQTPLPFLTAPPGRSWCRARDYAATLRSRALSYFLERFFLSRLASRRHTHPNPAALPYRAPHDAARATTWPRAGYCRYRARA